MRRSLSVHSAGIAFSGFALAFAFAPTKPPPTLKPVKIRNVILRTRLSHQLAATRATRHEKLSVVTSRLKTASAQLCASPSTDDGDGQTNSAEVVLIALLRGLTLPFPALRKILIPKQYRKTSLSVGLTFRESLSAVSVYLIVGVLAYRLCLEPEWTIIDSLYFVSTCFTTVGYGDLTPTNTASKIFTCVFGFGGIATLGTAIATLGSTFGEAEVEAVEATRHSTQERIMDIFDDMPNFLRLHRNKPQDEQERERQKARKKLERGRVANSRVRMSPALLALKKLLLSTLPFFTVVVGGGAVMKYLNNDWTTFDSIYYGLITSSTIGFGDVTPQTQKARLFAVVFVPLAVATAGELVSAVALSIMERRQRQVYENQLKEGVTLKHLLKMDQDGDGKITRKEYVQFMLLEMGRVDKKEVDELVKQFDRLDVTRSGYLDNEDLKLMAKLRGATLL